jgi:hypothetical protein
MEVIRRSSTSPVEPITSKVHDVTSRFDKVCVGLEAFHSMILWMGASDDGAIPTKASLPGSVQIMVADDIVWNTASLYEL